MPANKLALVAPFAGLISAIAILVAVAAYITRNRCSKKRYASPKPCRGVWEEELEVGVDQAQI